MHHPKERRNEGTNLEVSVQDVELVDVSESAAELHEDAQHLVLLEPPHRAVTANPPTATASDAAAAAAADTATVAASALLTTSDELQQRAPRLLRLHRRRHRRSCCGRWQRRSDAKDLEGAGPGVAALFDEGREVPAIREVRHDAELPASGTALFITTAAVHEAVHEADDELQVESPLGSHDEL